MPERIQLKRTKGWRMPPNTVKVDRSTKFGNPFVVGEVVPPNTFWRGLSWFTVESAEHSVELFRHWVLGTAPEGHTNTRYRLIVQDALPALRGKNLACWCKPGDPCHADVLLELANQPAPTDKD